MNNDEYKLRGAYHNDLNLSQRWLPRYFRRLHIVKEVLYKYIPHNALIIDAGSGEGELIEALRGKGFVNAFGIDAFAPFKLNSMIRGNLQNNPIKSNSVDAVIALDVFEHFPLEQQQIVTDKISMILKPGGIALVSFPNMAHLASRFKFMFSGRPWRNALLKHPGELTLCERLEIIKKSNLLLLESCGLHFTLRYNPSPKSLIGPLLTKLMFNPSMPPSLCWTVVLLLAKSYIPECFANLSEHPLKTALKTYQPVESDPTKR